MTLQVQVVSPERVLWSGEAERVVTRVEEGGDIAFLTGHTTYLGQLGSGVTEIATVGGDVVKVAVHGGFVVKDSEHALGGRRPRTAWANLVRAGRDLAPAWGIDGELVAARSVVAVVEQGLPRARAT